MVRGLVWSSLWLVLGCGGDASGDDNVYVAPSFITGSTTSSTTESNNGGAVDTGDFGAADPLVPPADVDSDCWSWEIFYEDGTAEETQLRLYDGLPDPNVLYHEIDEGPNGRINEVANFEYLDGERTLAWYDEDNDGTPEREYRTTFDSDGNILTYWLLEDGEIEFWTYTLDADGKREQLDVDEGDNGTIDVVWRYTYDSLDRRERIEGDRGDNGTVDELYLYDFPGTQDRLYTRRYFDDPDSAPSETATIRMSDDDRYLEREEENEEIYFRYIYEYDGNDNLVRVDGEVEQAEGGSYSFVYSIEWFDKDRIESETYDYDLEGFAYTELVREFVYDWYCDE